MRLGQWVVLLGVLVACVPGSRADDPIGWASFGGSGGFSSYVMSDVNDRINGDGNRFLEDKAWKKLDAIGHGWTFWGELKIPLPLGDLELPIPFTDAGLPMEFFISGGYSHSSGNTGGPDSNELLEVETREKAFFMRLLYTVPYRFHNDIRLFITGGPLFIREQEISASHTSRSSAGGGAAGRITERIEKVTYGGDGMGWHLGIAAEYMMLDHVTLAIDLGYRWANIKYGSWNYTDNVEISDTDPADLDDGTTSLERLHREDSYVFYGFIDWEATEDNERMSSPEIHTYGPHLLQLIGLSQNDLGIDMSGIQAHLGFRFYFL